MNGDEPISDGLRAYLLGKGAEIDPANVDLAQLNLLRDPECKLYAAVEVGIAAVQNDPGLAEQLYQIARPIYDRMPHGSLQNVRHIEGLGDFTDISLRTLTLAALLHKTADVDAMLKQLIPLASGQNGMTNTIVETLLEAAARVSPEFAYQVYDSINGKFKRWYLPQVVTGMAPNDPEGTLRLLNMIAAKNSNNGYIDSFDTLPIIRALGRKDPAAVLALAKDNTRDNTMEMLAAACFQPKAVARTILQEVFSDNSTCTIMNIAMADAVDPDFAKQLYSKYKTNLEAESYDFYVLRPGIGVTSGNRVQYAYLISDLDPVEARLIMETEFANGTQAIFALDQDGVPAMLEALRMNGSYLQPSLQQRIMQYILMTREERASASPAISLVPGFVR